MFNLSDAVLIFIFMTSFCISLSIIQKNNILVSWPEPIWTQKRTPHFVEQMKQASEHQAVTNDTPNVITAHILRFHRNIFEKCVFVFSFCFLAR